MNLEKLSDLILQILVLTLPYFAAVAAAWVKAKYELARAELDEKKRYALDLVISYAVKAAEQIYKDGNGDVKKQYALGVAEAYIAKTGLKIELDDLEAKIESAVFAEISAPLPVIAPQG